MVPLPLLRDDIQGLRHRGQGDCLQHADALPQVRHQEPQGGSAGVDKESYGQNRGPMKISEKFLPSLMAAGIVLCLAAVSLLQGRTVPAFYHMHQYIDESGDTTSVCIPAMARGKTTFRCPECGGTFKDWDIEYMASAMSCPMPCPDCGTMSPAVKDGNRPTSLVDKLKQHKLK